MSKSRFKIVTRSQGNNARVIDGVVKPESFEFEFIDVPVLVHGFRRMVRELEFDICEMALTTYLCAREHGVQFTALPIFLVRNFHHGAIYRKLTSESLNPADLEGKRVGVNRGYTVTTGVWARSILHDEYGVDLSKVTWVLTGDEHVEAYRPPSNVVPLPDGHSMEELLISGDLAAAVGASLDSDAIGPLLQEPFEAGVTALQNRGFYPINHLMVVRNDVLAENPTLAEQLFELFAESKRLYIEDLKAGKIESLSPVDKVHLRAIEINHDPLPYGIEPNREILQQLINHALMQRILKKPTDVNALFAESTLELIA
ncbi:MAG: ABC transporter substrate-binding protein [Gammaproteobacteria bacterium]|nr:ABC transporter substrate-binding protein [Gammaproteobacteria bacterium]